MFNHELNEIQKDLSCCIPSQSTKKNILVAFGVVGAVAAIGITAAAVYNCKQMRAARALKRTGKLLYMLGTTMRNISGMEPLA